MLISLYSAYLNTSGFFISPEAIAFSKRSWFLTEQFDKPFLFGSSLSLRLLYLHFLHKQILPRLYYSA